MVAQQMISIQRLNKIYDSGLQALHNVNLEIQSGEIFALLGPNGAGKTTLISIICGLVRATSGQVFVDSQSIESDYRSTRAKIGLVPQELHTDMFETVGATVRFSRGLFGLPPSASHIEHVLKQLSLWSKRNDQIMTLSGGMKRRVLIAKALAHEPKVLFLDEPTAGVDVELRKDMWTLVRHLRESGVTIILTTHYIEEAEEMADRVGIIRKGKLILVDEKLRLMKKLGKRRLRLTLKEPMSEIPPALANWHLTLGKEGHELEYTFVAEEEGSSVPDLLQQIHHLEIGYHDLNTQQSSLEEIFVDLVSG